MENNYSVTRCAPTVLTAPFDKKFPRIPKSTSRRVQLAACIRPPAHRDSLLNRLTLCFSKKLENLVAAFAMFAAYYNYCWQTRKPGTSGKKRPTACLMAGLTGHVRSFDELFEAVLKS